MTTRSIIYMLVLFVFVVVTTLLVSIGELSMLSFHLIFAIIFYLNYRSYGAIIFLLFILMFVDVTLQLNIAYSFLSWTLAGLAVSLINKVLPLLRQQPFTSARIVWLIIAVVVFRLFQNDFSLSVNIIPAVILNMLIMLALTYMLEPFIGERRSADITID